LFFSPGEAVPFDHLLGPLPSMGVQAGETAPENRQQFVPERIATDHPLEVVSTSVVVWAVEFRARDLLNQPVKELFVPNVHSDSHLWLQTVPPEMAFSYKYANEKALIEFVHSLRIQATCFTVKFPVKHGVSLENPAILIFNHAGLSTAVLGKKRALRMVGQNEKRSARTKMRTAVENTPCS